MILAVVGPTCVGKTKMSVELAKKYNAIIINADAVQVYKGLDIGSAKVREDEKDGVPHFLFDIKEVDEEYSIYDYQKDVRKLLEEYKDRNIIFVGGTGLYLKSALYDYRLSSSDNRNDYSMYSNEELYKMVLEKDPNSKIHINNRVRMERFLDKEDITYVPPVVLYPHTLIGLTTDRDLLYERINNRVDIMIQSGLLNEVKSFYDRNIRTKPLMSAIGYKELYEFFDNKVSLNKAIDNIKKNSRHYAKRQYTFFNNQFNVNWFEADFNDFNNTIKNVCDFIDREVLKDDRS